MLGQYVRDPVSGHGLAVPVEEHELLIGSAADAAKPVQRLGSLRPQRNQALLLALAEQSNMPRRSQLQGVPAQACGLAHPGPAVVEQEQQRVVAPSAVRTPVGHVDDQSNVLCLQVGGRPLPCLLRGDGQHPHVLLGVGQVAAQQVLEEAADRRPPAVPCRRRVRPFELDVIEEARHHVGVEVAQLQGGNTAAKPLSHELDQQRQRVAVGPDGVNAGAPLLGQVVGEVRLDLREQAMSRCAAHGLRRLPSECCSKRWLASSSNWGVALR